MYIMTPLLPSQEVVFHPDDGESPTTSTRSRKSMLESNHERRSTKTASKPRKEIQTQVKKQVNFNGKVRVRKISTHRRYSEEERASMWYSSEEFQDIRKGAISTVKKMMKKIPVDNDPDDSSRGLEFKTPKKNKIRQARKSDILWTVLSELAICEEKGGNTELVAQIYTSCSRVCYEEAAKRGAMDAIDAWSLTHENCPPRRKKSEHAARFS